MRTSIKITVHLDDAERFRHTPLSGAYPVVLVDTVHWNHYGSAVSVDGVRVNRNGIPGYRRSHQPVRWRDLPEDVQERLTQVIRTVRDPA